MTIGVIGRKCGMTRYVTEAGAVVAATVIEVQDNRVAQVKTAEQDGYLALQVAHGRRRPTRVTRALKGHHARAGIEPGAGLHEWPLADAERNRFEIGQPVPVTIFRAGQDVDVQGLSRGKGFAGTIKRHHFSSQDATHGNSRAHRAPGSIGQRQTPGRVFKGKKMAGHLGHTVRRIQNLRVLRVDEARGLLFIAGAVPGSPGTVIAVTPAVKHSRDAGQS
ncbi:Ribosomal protein L3, bacterial/organelle-type [mine drainage metagenome]|uniref:Ribosomal protein L3, bacterial/organelle-type n=2 Tax=mine drainage metagenome TaxID=410659 RepID=T1CXZ3_9ZZZZ